MRRFSKRMLADPFFTGQRITYKCTIQYRYVAVTFPSSSVDYPSVTCRYYAPLVRDFIESVRVITVARVSL